MKKRLEVMIIIITIVFLSSCGIRERLLAPPDEWEAPEGTMVATCTVDDNVYKYLYKDDGIYQYYVNDVMQGDLELDEIQEQAFLNGESVENYLNTIYNSGECIITEYYPE